MPIVGHHGITPEVPDTCFVAPNADVIGDVVLGPYASLWFHTVARGDINGIRIGAYTNIQDLSMLHVADTHQCIVGDYVTGGHRVILHGCTIENDVLIGMGATVMNGAHVGTGSIVGAGAVVTEGTQVPPCSLVLGVPGKIVKTLPEDTVLRNRYWAQKYTRLQCSYRGVPPPEFPDPVIKAD